MAGDVDLKKSQGSYMKLKLKIVSCCAVSITIPIVVMVITQILLRSS